MLRLAHNPQGFDVDDEAILVATDRRSTSGFKHRELDEFDLPDRVRVRLWLARQLALSRYNDIYG